jgi:hypothetical protein
MAAARLLVSLSTARAHHIQVFKYRDLPFWVSGTVRSYAGAIEMGEECFPGATSKELRGKHALLIAVTTVIHRGKVPERVVLPRPCYPLVNEPADRHGCSHSASVRKASPSQPNETFGCDTS